MSEKLYGVDQFYPGDFVQILTGVYNMEDSFMFRKRAIGYSGKKTGRYDLHLLEELLMKAYE